MTQALSGIKSRMKSVENIHKITRAMEMVSLSKLNRVKNALFVSRHYLDRLETVVDDFLAAAGDIDHPLLKAGPSRGKTGLCVITSDTGLCSTYNQNIIRSSEEFVSKFRKEDVIIMVVGKEGFYHFKKSGFEIRGSCLELHGRYQPSLSEEMVKDMISLFLDQDAREIFIAYTHFENTLRHKPRIEKFLNIERPLRDKIDYMIMEPDAKSVADELMPRYLSGKFRSILLESLVSEHSARMVAMKTATDNANDLMSTLTLMRNKARQAAITKEVIEIASAAEAMRI